MAESGGMWGRATAAVAPPVVSVEGEGRVGAAGEERWRHFDSSVNAVSFGFVATAILIAMFLVMAIFERFLRPRPRAPPPSRRAWHRGLWGFAGDPHSPPQQPLHDGDSPHHLRQAPYAGKLDQLPPPKVPVHAQEVSVLMPGQAVPTFIAQPAPPPCPREPVAWPSHHHHIPLPGGAS
ncbi:unnamed protein product [Spirodela intermedia]|uniref:Uncharacterized protein n=2 Tax=Spirodela intermedia TaxID=51605 RepID=A0A7I8K5C6_SPIIN|nr:unnamed protein product [Spirodela intermedia]CAA6656669.1 unnamed protein product [Spirodela intermedia]CAA7392364.1 unnamed protein product [Spirodela intermedia]